MDTLQVVHVTKVSNLGEHSLKRVTISESVSID